MFGIGAPELVLILVLALIFIGPQKLPEMARMFGRSYREFQRAFDGAKEEFTSASETLKREADLSAQKPNILDARHPVIESGNQGESKEH